MKYRKKPVVVEAIQWTGENYAEVAEWLSDRGRVMFRGVMGTLRVPTLNGDVSLEPGEWIVRGVKGEVYPCRADIFAETYEAVNE